MIQKKTQIPRPKNCMICDRPSIGHHCGVATCKGCKTFFRRMTVSNLHFTCELGDCFDLEKRNNPLLRCRACRYQKCIDVGMNPLSLDLKENELEASNFQKLVKRTNEKESDEEIKKKIISLCIVEDRLQKTIDNLVYLESKLEAFRASAYNPHWREIEGVENILKTGSRIYLADNYGPHSEKPFEILKLRAFPQFPTSVAVGLSKGPMPYIPDRKIWFSFNLLTTLEYGKTLPVFHKLDFEDRMILTKHVALACTNLHISYFTVSKKCEDTIHPDGSPEIYRDKVHYPIKLISIQALIRYKIQRTEYVLLKAICFCNPAVPNLSNHAQEHLYEQQKLYADALLRHCLTQNAQNGPARFAQLLGILQILERQQRIQKDLFVLGVKPVTAKFSAEDKISVVEEIMDP